MFNAKKVKNEIIQWIRDYFEKNGTSETCAVIGISGGKDSSIVAALCEQALGRGRVFGVFMPQGLQYDLNIAKKLEEHLGIECAETNIRDAVMAVDFGLHSNELESNDLVKFNIPARIRMTMLYAVSASIGGRVANTSNLSENYIGWCTKFGDSAGDFAPLANLTVTEVKAIGRELGLPAEFIDKVPEDGLCGETDEENFGFTYDVLDRYIREGVCEDVEIKDKIDKMHAYSRHKFEPMPSFRFNN